MVLCFKVCMDGLNGLVFESVHEWSGVLECAQMVLFQIERECFCVSECT